MTTGNSTKTPALFIENLNVMFNEFHALKDASITVESGSSFGLVGESGSGKSTLLRAVAGLAPTFSGKVEINGKPVPTPRDKAFYNTVQMVFQDPYGSLHPRQTVDRLLLEPLAIHGIKDTEKRIVRALDEVGLGSGFRFRYPHQLSGGQRQRIAIARALIVEPSILLLDEPTSALDASVQAEVLNLLEQIRRDRKLTFVMVSHDLAVITHMCDELAVMQNGTIVEKLKADDLAKGNLKEDYTRNLMNASEGFKR
ncbi:ABC transporter ATP-binding protein [Pseudochrobactrum asaccharolyticum]|jgi:peptide/nickel transport system ATP-binding protein|uniref:Glutathione import ATP-binding protein GsiA n=1 Tax=Pseudochrobactrum asaccharolyticum TaxID=354351 RepID=A0A366DY73_9HYPH|nr:ABC transporter ATP-binding protein [Pseudochrobactrum asaccharolyticum]MBX8799385.1 ABC transporter ATP-binding protein [Ochrobactrum sp. MR28]MBX8814900.1 ABC transporter ATP-binding protein [Ochrobactrum sp. MR31]MCF7672549.1 ABC transporter ATP-binding protein [Bacillus subtilis]MDR2312687.1 ABC transporter ATP-binding protein [Brucellaceae bacterium]MCF7646082.1 ABC transporter ATP-binding protein [Pseudochrobactrum asaccharolyticum]